MYCLEKYNCSRLLLQENAKQFETIKEEIRRHKWQKDKLSMR